MEYHRECLYNVEWQKLRMSLLGSWRSNIQDTTASITALRQYTSYGSAYYSERVWRVLNLLNAVLLSYAQIAKKVRPASTSVGQDTIEVVTSWRDHFSKEHAAHPLPKDAKWDWSTVAEDIKKADKIFIARLKANLGRRRKTALYRGKDPSVTRPELTIFLQMLEAYGQ